MPATRLLPHQVNKPWGRRDIPGALATVAPGGEPVGEVWFEDDGDAPAELLVKFLFTSERLSIQTHPDDARARAAGQARGKDEAWLILSAEPGASIAVGTVRALDEPQLREAAVDGSIMELVDWRPVAAGAFIYSPAGTIHAIGGGISLIEVQQNCDITYRLYDYGRDRELHLEEGLAAARAEVFEDRFRPEEVCPGRTILCRGKKFVVERWHGLGPVTVTPAPNRPMWITPLSDGGRLGGEPADFGSVWRLDSKASAELSPAASWLVAYPGADIAVGLLG